MSEATQYLVVVASDADKLREAIEKLAPSAASEQRASGDGSHVAFGPQSAALDDVLGKSAALDNGETYVLPTAYSALTDAWFGNAAREPV